MFRNKSSPSTDKGKATVESSLFGMANMLALIAAFLVCPQIYEHSADPVYGYLLNSYGDRSLAEFGVFVWTGLSTACVYFLSRAIFVLALMVIAQRLLFMFAF